MDKKTARLGRGLDALFTDGAGAEPHHVTPGSEPMRSIPVAAIQANPHQPRKTFDEEELIALEDSIKAHGVLVPILVRPLGDGYQLVAGERRLRAAMGAGLTEIPAHVRDMDERQLIEAALVENIQRTDLNPIEKATSFRDYMERYDVTQEHLANRIGVDRTTITNLVGLLNLPLEVQEFVRSGALSLGHAKILKGLGDAGQQHAFARDTIAKNLTVAGLEALVKQAKAETPGEKEPPRPVAGVKRTNHVKSIEDELRQKLALRVAIKLKAKDKGQIVLSFESNDDFERVVEALRK